MGGVCATQLRGLAGIGTANVRLGARALAQTPSSRLRCPPPPAVCLFGPPRAAVSDVVAMGDQPLMQMAGEQGNAVRRRMVPEEVAGEADLPASARAPVRPDPTRATPPRVRGGRAERGRGGPGPSKLCMGTPVLAGKGLVCHPWARGGSVLAPPHGCLPALVVQAESMGSVDATSWLSQESNSVFTRGRASHQACPSPASPFPCSPC